jgi:hypothetical protein
VRDALAGNAFGDGIAVVIECDEESRSLVSS